MTRSTMTLSMIPRAKSLAFIRSQLAYVLSAMLVLMVVVSGGALAQTASVKIPGLSPEGPIRVEVDEGVIQPIPIAIAFSSAPAAGSTDVGAQIARVISADLERSGYFAPVDPAAFIDTNPDVTVEPKYENWQSLNALGLVNGRAYIDADGRLQVDFRLWDVFNKRQLIGQNLTATPENWRRIAHKIADLIYEKLTGFDGYFDTRLVFVAEGGTRGKRILRLAIMDQDAANPSYLSDGRFKIMSPRFSADGQQIAYMALSADSARLYIFDIGTVRQESLGSIKGMAFAPRFSPDGTKLAFTVVQAGNSDVYIMDLRTRQMRRLTRDPGIDTSPSFSADGTQIVFNSDRGGSPQLYIMGADGSNPRRISFGGGRYTTPVFSPKGDLIAFTKQSQGRFSIGIMKADGSEEKLLTTSYLEEGPTWAPNSRYIMFFREPQNGNPSLWTVDVSGRIERQVAYPGGASDPSWSPLLK
jgi:TolB protein